MPKICPINLNIPIHQMFNGLGAGNIGDELMLLGFWEHINPLKSTIEIWDGSSPTKQWLPKKYHYLDWKDNNLCENAVLKSKAVLIVGDTPVSEMLGLEWPLKALSKRLLFCHQNNIPVHAIGVGVDQLQNPEAIKIFKEAFLPIKTWTTRSNNCRDALITLGVKSKNIMVGADLAWLHSSSDKYLEWAKLQWQSLGVDLTRPIIGINVVNEIWDKKERVKKTIAKALDKTVKKYDVQIAFLCNEIREGKFYDAEAARKTMSFMNQPNFLLPNKYYHPDEMISLLSYTTLTISQRYHFAVESVLAGTIPICFARGQKMQSLINELNLSPIGTMEKTKTKHIYNHVKNILQQHAIYLKNLNKSKFKLANRAKKDFYFINQLSQKEK